MSTTELIDQQVHGDAHVSHQAAASGSHVSVRILDASVQNHTSAHYWAWRQILDRDSEALICQHPDYVFHELSHSDTSRPDAPFVVAAGASGMGILIPKSIRTKDVSGMGPTWTLRGFRLGGNRFLGDQTPATQCTLLDAALHRLAEVRADFLLIEDVIEGSPLWELCHSQSSARFRVFLPKSVQARLRIRFPENAEDYWKQFKSNRRWNFRHKIKKFGNLRFDRITDIDQVSEFLEHAHHVSRTSWQADYLGLRIHNDKRESELLTFLATQEALRSYLLYKDGIPAAFVLGSQFNGYFDHAEIAYNRQFAKNSPGQVLLLKLLEDLIQQSTPTLLDFGGGDAEYKRIFANDEGRSGDIWLVPRTARSRLAIGYLKGCLAVNRSARAVLARSGQFKRVRQWIRR